MEVRTGSHDEIAQFGLFSEENDGESITVVECNGTVVAFAQHTGTTIYVMESVQRGAGSALVQWLLDGADYAAADNVTGVSEGFWARMGFEPEGRNAYGQPVWTWYPAE